MRMRGLEPPPGYPDTDLNRARLPIPPHPRRGGNRRYRTREILHRGKLVAPAPPFAGTSAAVSRGFASLPLLAAIVQGTRTPPSHGGNPGSNPGSGTHGSPAHRMVFVSPEAARVSSRVSPDVRWSPLATEEPTRPLEGTWVGPPKGVGFARRRWRQPCVRRLRDSGERRRR